ncbi:hypothetical protein RU96_GL000747 [Enterococcus canintestini]|uniref:Uncharacterized protein n=1 Tax=Enterococcus canintestini TaxID=317010 RepID=A0A1L8R463_9ENTE|nr:hypothetical protein RU96_GL000747 [Enterococcus canintestini]
MKVKSSSIYYATIKDKEEILKWERVKKLIDIGNGSFSLARI